MNNAGSQKGTIPAPHTCRPATDSCRAPSPAACTSCGGGHEKQQRCDHMAALHWHVSDGLRATKRAPCLAGPGSERHAAKDSAAMRCQLWSREITSTPKTAAGYTRRLWTSGGHMRVPAGYLQETGREANQYTPAAAQFPQPSPPGPPQPGCALPAETPGAQWGAGVDQLDMLNCRPLCSC